MKTHERENVYGQGSTRGGSGKRRRRESIFQTDSIRPTSKPTFESTAREWPSRARKGRGEGGFGGHATRRKRIHVVFVRGKEKDAGCGEGCATGEGFSRENTGDVTRSSAVGSSL